MTAVRYLGSGWGFPVAPDDSGTLPLAQGADKVRQSIQLILETEPGERLMRPRFGCGLRRYLMAPNTVATRALIQDDVGRALSLFEPRITLQGVHVTPGEDPALVYIAIAYVHTRDGQPGNLVFPFYLE
jgi:phage baseplate assembly protein W